MTNGLAAINNHKQPSKEMEEIWANKKPEKKQKVLNDIEIMDFINKKFL